MNLFFTISTFIPFIGGVQTGETLDEYLLNEREQVRKHAGSSQ